MGRILLRIVLWLGDEGEDEGDDEEDEEDDGGFFGGLFFGKGMVQRMSGWLRRMMLGMAG